MERRTGTGTVTESRNWTPRAPQQWANDPNSDHNGYISEHGQEQGSNDDRVNFEDNQLENGKLKRVEYGYSNDKFNNVTSIKEYDFGQTDSSLLKLQYGYGTTANNGNVLTQTITIGATVMNQSYVYDALNRLQTAQENSGASWTQTYDYDRYGNRAVRNTSYMPSPQLTPQSASSTDFTAFDQSTNRLSQTKFPNVLYDGAGNLTRDIVASTFSYDGENRQVTSSVGGTTASYFYDGDGRRVKKVVGTVTTVFVYNVAGQLIAEYTTDPVPPAAGGGGTSYLTADHLGSTRVVTGSDGTVKARYDYLPFGEEIAAGIGNRSTFNGYSQADGLRQKFGSYERDNETGLDFAQARYFSSIQGRFTSADDHLNDTRNSDPASWNLYAYVRNNPLRYVDPTGELVYVGNVTGSDLTELLKRANYTYGCQSCVSVDNNGFLQVNTAGLSKNVLTATQFLTDAINSQKDLFAVEVTNNNPDVAFGDSKAGAASVQLPGNSFRTSAVRIRLDFGDDKWVSGDKAVAEAFVNTVFAHEIRHFYPQYTTDPRNDPSKRGDVVNDVNEILLARGLPLRAQYTGRTSAQYWVEVPHGKAEIDKKTGLVVRGKDGINVQPTGKVIRWTKQQVGGPGIN